MKDARERRLTKLACKRLKWCDLGCGKQVILYTRASRYLSPLSVYKCMKCDSEYNLIDRKLILIKRGNKHDPKFLLNKLINLKSKKFKSKKKQSRNDDQSRTAKAGRKSAPSGVNETGRCLVGRKNSPV